MDGEVLLTCFQLKERSGKYTSGKERKNRGNYMYARERAWWRRDTGIDADRKRSFSSL